MADAPPEEAHVVLPEEESERLDRLLSARDSDRSRATYQRWIKEGRVTVDGTTATSRTRPKAGQRVVVHPARPPASAAVPQDLPLAVLYEDEHLIVVDKAAGMVVHPAAGHPDGTLVNAVLHHFGALPGDAPDAPVSAQVPVEHGFPGDADRGLRPHSVSSRTSVRSSTLAYGRTPAERRLKSRVDAGVSSYDRPGVVHRLDALTSGVMVIARSMVAKNRLVERFALRDIERAYLAIVLGALPAAVTYDTSYGRHPHHRKKFSSQRVTGKRAVTHVERLEALHGATLVRCRLETGRTHQIRVHLADHGHPLLGDPVYGRRSKDARLAAAHDALGRQALHAAILGFAHPVTGEPLRFEVDPPEDFARALAALRSE